MKVLYTCALLWASCLSVSAQYLNPVWARHDIAEGSSLYGVPLVMLDSSQNPVVCANDYHPGPLNAFLTTKYDASGALLWQRKFDTGSTDVVMSCVTDNQGAVYVGGQTGYNSIQGAIPGSLVIKYASNGDSLWAYRFSGPTAGASYGAKLHLDSANNLLVFGLYGDTVALKNGLFVTKLSPDGQVVWSSTYTDPTYSIGGMLDGGTARWVGDRWVYWGRSPEGQGYRYICWQIDSVGQTLTGAVTELDTANAVNTQHVDKTGNLIVGGWIKYRVVKYAPSGQKLWEYHKPNSSPSPFIVPARIACIESNDADEVYISGYFRIDSVGPTPLMTKLNDSSGTMLWEHSFVWGGIPTAFPNKITWISQEVFLVAGAISFSLDSNFYEFFLAVYNRDGFVNVGVTDLDGRRNSATSLALQPPFLYVAGYASGETVTEPKRQVLCKYLMNDIVSTRNPVNPSKLLTLSLWPNPATEWVRVGLPEDAEVKSGGWLELTDMVGRVLRSQRIESAKPFYDFSLEGMPSGAYIMLLRQNGQPTHIGRGIKL